MKFNDFKKLNRDEQREKFEQYKKEWLAARNSYPLVNKKSNSRKAPLTHILFFYKRFVKMKCEVFTMNYPVTKEFFLRSSHMEESDLNDSLKGLIDDICRLVNQAYADGMAFSKKEKVK